MKVSAPQVLISVAALLASNAHAQTSYIGLSRTTPGEAYANFPTAQNVENYNNPAATKLYGGMNVSERYAVEIGYGFFGTWKVADPAPGSTNEVRMSSKMMYAAGKASMPIGDSFSLFGKLGIAANRFSTERSGFSPSSDSSSIRPMVGFGADYKFTKHIAGVVEFNYYGTVGNNFKQQKLELGLKYNF